MTIDLGGRPKKWTPERLEEECDVFEEWLKVHDNYWFKSFAQLRGYSGDFMHYLEKRCERFAKLMELARSKQENHLWNRGLNTNSPGFIKWCLCTHHGYRGNPDLQEASAELAKNIAAIMSSVKTTNYNDNEIEVNEGESKSTL